MTQGTLPSSGQADATHLGATINLELRSGLAAEEVDRRVAQANRAGDVGARALAFYLADMADRRTHHELGFNTIEHYAERRYHIQPSTTREYVVVGRTLQDLPEIDRAFCDGELLWSHVRALARVATPQTESVWIDWARGRTAREIAAQSRLRDKGQLPTDPGKRRIHATTCEIRVKLNALQLQIWNNARARLEAARGEPVSDLDLLMELSRLGVQSSAESPDPKHASSDAATVTDSLFKVIVHHDQATGRTTAETADGLVQLDALTSGAILREAGGEDCCESDEPLNEGPDVPPEQRDIPTPPKLRAAVLARDGYRCRCCGSKSNLTVHHKSWRRYGGRTILGNLVTLCELCR